MSVFLRRRESIAWINVYDTGFVHGTASWAYFHIGSEAMIIFTGLEIVSHAGSFHLSGALVRAVGPVI